MSRISFFIIFILLILSPISCIGENSYRSIRGENQLSLKNIKMYEYRGDKKEAEVIAENLIYNRDKAEFIIKDGRILTDISLGSIKDKVDIGFLRAEYDVKNKRLNVELKDTIFIDRGVRLSAGNLELKTEVGDIWSLNKVKIQGGNFEFEGNGFFGNIKDGMYVFDEGVEARIF
ncbi:MAG: LPS export ABC transporter periplasmic protein LptC [Myxococcota bacterium]